MSNNGKNVPLSKANHPLERFVRAEEVVLAFSLEVNPVDGIC